MMTNSDTKECLSYVCLFLFDLNVSFILQLKRCECSNQLRSAPVHMGRENIKLNMHSTFHWQLMFITTSRKKNSQVALCWFVGLYWRSDIKWYICQGISHH